ncbi:MAG: excinuclease ABC subunit UvrC [Chloroflexi bacterium]|nr:excinuclease ABC subunit UvrC [Chloroflexota bacterium]
MATLHLEEVLKNLPDRPGVYVFKDSQGIPIYVGKASSLRSRVRSYFGARPAELVPKLEKMLPKVADLEYILAGSEDEALILECNLIKRYHPRFNVALRDDKSYPYLQITVHEAYPRVLVTRRRLDDGSRYFGPYASAGSLRSSLDLAKKLFPFCSLTRPITGATRRPCLDYYLGRCLGACIGACTPEEYRAVVDRLILFLQGKQGAVVRTLHRQMEGAAARLEFERAARLRDQLAALERVIAGQRIVSPRRIDADVVALAQDRNEAWVEVFFVREGKLVGRDHFVMEGAQDEHPSRIMASFIPQFYGAGSDVPPTLYLQGLPAETEVLQRWLGGLRGKGVRLVVPRRGQPRQLMDMVVQNAQEGLAQLKVRWWADAEKTHAALADLREALSLPRLPQRIECYDISNIQGTSAVGSMVVFQEGRPRTAHYRRFRIKAVPGADDYAMLQEVLRRRFHRAPAEGAHPELAEGDIWAIVPDLVLIDGGKGQLSAVLEVLGELGVKDVPLASLAKEKEEVFLPGRAESLMLPRTSGALYLLQRVRDEAHRFALAYHLQVRQRRTMHSPLDEVPGIGPKRKRALIRHFGSLKGVREAPVEEVAALPGFTRQLAEKVKAYL